jgi:hypothetical protein
VGSGSEQGNLLRIGKQLWVDGISRAGTYGGQARAVANQDTANISVSLAVSDWWPYAALTISAGVLLGHWLTRYYRRTRPADLQRIRVGQTRRDLAIAASQMHQTYGGRSFLASYDLTPLASATLSDALAKLRP